MWVLLKDFLLVSMGMGIGVVLMCILNVGKEADYEMNLYCKSLCGRRRGYGNRSKPYPCTSS